MSEKQTSAERFGFVATLRPDWAQAFGAFFRAGFAPAEPVLDRRTRVLLYLSALASVGAVDGFRTHLEDAREEGLSRAEILEAILVGVPAVGYTRVLDTVEALAEYPDPSDD